MHWAWPETTATAPHPTIVVPASVKSIVPSLTAPVLLTVAVRVVELLGEAVNDGLVLEASVVVVVAVLAVVMLRLQPPAIAPVPSPPDVVITYRLQVPLGLSRRTARRTSRPCQSPPDRGRGPDCRTEPRAPAMAISR